MQHPRYTSCMTETWDFLQSPAAGAAWNMALDEALLHTAAKRGRPLLRVYAWEKPSVSFGYFQKFPETLAERHEVVRRPTGGGVVYHVQDTTYTVVVPPSNALYAMKTADAYCALHEAVAAAFESQPALHRAPLRSPQGQYECFQRPVHGDVVADGRKLAGGAQRRTKSGLLHQGSIAVKLSADQIKRGFQEALGVGFEIYELVDVERTRTEKLVREKYATDAWNRHLR
jgi:lipoate-protein ligase A